MRDNKKFPTLCLVGHMRHGKDSMAEILQDEFGLRFKSSSEAAAEIFIYDVLSKKYGYETPFECFEPILLFFVFHKILRANRVK